MSAPTTDQFTDLAARAQEAVTSAVRTWADAVQTYAGTLTGGQPSLPDLDVAVDRYFDVAQQVLDGQRRLVHTVLTAGAETAESVSEQAARAAQSVAAHTANAAGAAAEKATDVTEAAAEQAKATATATARAAKAAATRK